MKLSSIVSLLAVSLVAATPMAVAQGKESAAIGIVQNVTSLNPMNSSETQDQLILRQNERFDIHPEIDRENYGIRYLITEWVTRADVSQQR